MSWAMHVLLVAAVALTMLCAIGLAVVRDPLEKLHYMAPVSTIAAGLILLAVICEEGLGQASLKALLIALLLMATNAMQTHATARAIRIRAYGHAPRPESHEEEPDPEQEAR